MAGLGEMGVVPFQGATAMQQGQQAGQMAQMRQQQMQAMHLHNLMTLGKLHDQQVEAQSMKTAFTATPGNSPTDVYHKMVQAGEMTLQGGDIQGGLRILGEAQKQRTAQYDQAYKAMQTVHLHLQTVQSTLDQLSAQLPHITTAAQWQHWNQEVEQRTGGPSPFAQIPYSPAAVKSAQEMSMSLSHQIAMKKAAADQAVNATRLQQTQERLGIARKTLALAQMKGGYEAKVAAAKVKELEAIAHREEQLASGAGKEHGAIMHPHKISTTDMGVAQTALQAAYPHMDVTPELTNQVAERAQSIMDSEHVPQEQAVQEAVRSVAQSGGILGHDTSGTLLAPAYSYQGKSFPRQDVEAAAKAEGISVSEYIKKHDLKPES